MTAPVETPPELPGYRVTERLGGGGQGSVWAALDLALDRPVALKVLTRLDAVARERFVSEGRALARVRHPGVAQIHAAGVLADGRPYLAMERFGTGTLAQRLTGGERVSTYAAVDVGVQMLQALAAVHAEGLLHRDLKASNVLWDRATGRVKLADFGLARASDRRGPTLPGAVVGSLEALAPERMAGDPATVASDLWSVGAVLYGLLAGRPPFLADPEQPGALGAAYAEGPAPLPADVPAAVARVCLSLLAVAPGSRPRTALEAAERLRAASNVAVTDTTPASARRAAPTDTQIRGRRRTLVGLAGLALAAAVWAARPGPQTRPEAPVPEVPARVEAPSDATRAPEPTPPTAPSTVAPSLGAPPSRPAAPPTAAPRRVDAPAEWSRTPRNQRALEAPVVDGDSRTD
ncbi:MAG: protein kinase domain-containing protein [Bradymonadia bacterium]